jgi:hypothetical protein
MRPDQGQESQSLEWGETKPESISNIQANLGGRGGRSERIRTRQLTSNWHQFGIV